MKRGYVYALIGALLLAGLVALRACKDKKTDVQIASSVLAPSDSAKIIIDPQHHRITTVTHTGPVKNTYLPPHITSVTIGNDGKVTVHARQWGTEVSPFLGLALGSDIRGRAALGLNLFYVKQWEAGAGVLLSSDIHDTRVFVHVSYSPYASYFVSVGIDNKQTAHLLAGLKF